MQQAGIALAAAGPALIGADAAIGPGRESTSRGFLLGLGAGLSWAVGNPATVDPATESR